MHLPCDRICGRRSKTILRRFKLITQLQAFSPEENQPKSVEIEFGQAQELLKNLLANDASEACAVFAENNAVLKSILNTTLHYKFGNTIQQVDFELALVELNQLQLFDNSKTDTREQNGEMSYER